MFSNIPDVKLGIIAVSRDCFPIALSEMRRANIVKAYGPGLYECPVTVENEKDMLKAWPMCRLPALTPWWCSWATSAPRPPKR